VAGVNTLDVMWNASTTTEGTAQLWGKVTVDESGNAAHDTRTECDASGNQALPNHRQGSGGKAADPKATFVGRSDAQRHLDVIALGRPATPNDIAHGILFLCASNYTNGHCLVNDGLEHVHPRVLAS
jgi:NAD(P)-dependent dehydrogenase (short-subunit alcohol dehydrogenase family)